MRHILTAIASLALAWPCHGAEPYDVLRILANWEWELVDIDDPRDADLLVFPRNLENAIPIEDALDQLALKHDEIDSRLNAERDGQVSFDWIVALHFPLSSPDDLKNPKLVRFLELEASLLATADSLLAGRPWSLPPSEEMRDCDWRGLTQVITSTQRAFSADLVKGRTEAALHHIQRLQLLKSRLDQLEAPDLMVLIDSMLASKGMSSTTCYLLERLEPTNANRAAIIELRKLNKSSKVARKNVRRSLQGEHLFFRASVNELKQSKDPWLDISWIGQKEGSTSPLLADAPLIKSLRGLSASFSFQPNRTIRQAAGHHRQWIAQWHLPWEKIREAESRLPETEPLSPDRLLIEIINGNGCGDALTYILTAQRFPLVRNVLSTNSSRDLTQLALAIRLYQADNDKALPDSLEKLVPDYLAQLPVDPFASRPYRFRVVGDDFVLWGVGPDCVDQGAVLDMTPITHLLIDHQSGESKPVRAPINFDNDITLRLPILPKPYPAGE
ncbi:hypothetical protein [Sulfuriroseicoccus oceanibius]|uniref:Uncharacterized protein n=1 Tax=Sulfuriroseicoccus oceanibius TaxID=2707525 RepID=A0A6B3LB92_9BACT|nr:hypothetical protein [Sulfuriroseicoccus oceanibius]QQL44393.1 hypothetical protein G3M56_010925 [Sulfuriroseicoccus oceanibius]